jgi:hypothetical protein
MLKPFLIAWALGSICMCGLVAYYSYYDEPFNQWIAIPIVIAVAVAITCLVAPRSVHK